MQSSSDEKKRGAALILIAIIGSTIVAGTQVQQVFAAVNGLPTVNPIPDQMVDELTFLTFNVTAFDPDGQQLVFSLQNAPYGASINPATGVFTWTPSEEQGSGVYHVNVVVSDGIVISSGSVMIIVNDVGGGGDGEGRKVSFSNTDETSGPGLGSSDLGVTNLIASPSNIPLDGTTSLTQESEAVNNGTLMTLTVQEPDGDVCIANGEGSSIPTGGLSKEYPTDFTLMIDAGDGICDTGDVGIYEAQSQVSTNYGMVQNSAQFQTDSPFVLPESPIGLIALLGSSLAVLATFIVIKGRSSKI